MGERVLDRVQVAHLRHWDNLSRRQRHDWSLFNGKGAGEFDFGSTRFQLAFMMYGLALTHRHRLPAAPGLFAPTMRRLMDQLLMPDVWLYWRDLSKGGSPYNAHLMGGYEEQWDPVAQDNIQYSAYVQSGANLHDYLFGEDRYAEPGSLTFRYSSFYWGGEEQEFRYDRDSLNEHIYWLMVCSGYVGIACVPNCVFLFCNQPAILGFRMHDLVTGGNRADEVVRSYKKVWEDFGILDEAGHYNLLRLEDSGRVVSGGPARAQSDGNKGALLNMWHRDFVHRHYRRQIGEYLERSPGGNLQTKVIPDVVVPGLPTDVDNLDFGWMAAWASEMGDQQTLDGLFAHADSAMSPTYLDRGLYYPRNDTKSDGAGNNIEVAPFVGNVLLGYARLNVPDGLWGLYNVPWPDDHFTLPALTSVARDIEVTQAENIDGVLRARVERIDSIVDLPSYRSIDDDPEPGTVTVGRLPDRCEVLVDGVGVSVDRDPGDGRNFTFTVPWGGPHRLEVVVR